VQFLLYIVAVVIMLEAAVLVVLNRRLSRENQHYHECMTVLFIQKLELEAENYQLKKRLGGRSPCNTKAAPPPSTTVFGE